MTRKMTEAEWQNLYENFETFDLLTCVDHLDQVRYEIGDGENFAPPDIRIDLMKLHDLAMTVVNQGETDQAEDLFLLADDLNMQVFGMIEHLKYIQQILRKLVRLTPDLE